MSVQIGGVEQEGHSLPLDFEHTLQTSLIILDFNNE